MTDDEETIRLDIRQHMHTGLRVYDVGGEKVGTVDDYDLLWEYMIVRPHSFYEKKLYIPFDLIANIDPREVFVSQSADELRRDYTSPPPRNATVDLPPPDQDR